MRYLIEATIDGNRHFVGSDKPMSASRAFSLLMGTYGVDKANDILEQTQSNLCVRNLGSYKVDDITTVICYE